MPCSTNSSSAYVRAKKPRSSSCRSTSITVAGARWVVVKIIGPALPAQDRGAGSGDRVRRDPAQRVVHLSGLLELPHALEAQVPAAGELLEGQRVLGVCARELLDAIADRPRGPEVRQHPCDLRAVHLVG